MLTSVAKKPAQNETIIIYDHYGVVWQKSNSGFWASWHQITDLTVKNGFL